MALVVNKTSRNGKPFVHVEPNRDPDTNWWLTVVVVVVGGGDGRGGGRRRRG